MRLVLDTNQPNFVKRIAKITINTTLDVVCACPIIFEENEIGISIAPLYSLPILISSAFAIVKDMTFHPQFNKQITPQKNKSLDASPTVKRIRLTSPSHSPPHKNTHAKPKDQRISLVNEDPNSISDILDNEVSVIIYIILKY